uniref:Uncharacterized protein n=1 Tax=Kalanchoe fedtschenkoi TaxID=63787 RepID=A0A7N0TB06_KALFE
MYSSSPIRHRGNSNLFARCFCFEPQEAATRHHHSLAASDSPSSSSSGSPRSVSEFAEVKQKCRSLIKNRFGRAARRRSADLSYDPISYALNFDDVGADDRLPLRNFPATPPRAPVKWRV